MLQNKLYVFCCPFFRTLSNTPIPGKSRKLHGNLTWRTIKSILLDPADIPGASFIEEELEKFTVAEQKFLLKCRRINQNGNNKQLLER